MIEVTCAIIRNDEGKVLVVRRGPNMGNAGKWEFPGGKIKKGESQEDCIIREIHEELGIDIILAGSLEPVEHDYGDKYIRLYPFICDTLAPRLFLAEHDAHKWLVPGHLLDVNLSAADVPVARDYALKFPEVQCDTPEEEPEMVPELSDDRELSGLLTGIASTHEIDMIAFQAANDPLLLSQLFSLSLSGDKRTGFRASWPLSKVVDINTEITIPYLGMIIDRLPEIKNESVIRAFLRILVKNQTDSIPVSHHGRLADYCFQRLRSSSESVAPRVYSMEILGNLCAVYPEMKSELVALINIVTADSSAGMKAQARKVLSRIIKEND